MKKKPDTLVRLAEMVRLSRICCDITRQAIAIESLQEDDRLDDVLDRRGELLSRISDIEQGLETDTQGERKVLSGIQSRDRKAAGLLLRDFDQSMRQLQQADLELHSKIKTELDDLGASLTRLRLGHTALKRYAPYHASEPRCIDRKG
jgi:hypothetical protein